MEAEATKTPQDSQKIFLDDIRLAPDDTWRLVRTALDFCEAMSESDEITHVSLDFDLEDSGLTGYGMAPSFNGLWVAQWMVKTNNIPTEKIIVHSTNAHGAQMIVDHLVAHVDIPVERRPYLII